MTAQTKTGTSPPCLYIPETQPKNESAGCSRRRSGRKGRWRYRCPNGKISGDWTVRECPGRRSRGGRTWTAPLSRNTPTWTKTAHGQAPGLQDRPVRGVGRRMARGRPHAAPQAAPHRQTRARQAPRGDRLRRRVHDDAGVRETLARGEPERFRRVRASSSGRPASRRLISVWRRPASSASSWTTTAWSSRSPIRTCGM